MDSVFTRTEENDVMSKTILNVKPISQLFPLPLVMGCEGVSAAMLLQYNHHTTKATDIMKNWPTHKNNPYKGYVGHQLFIKFGHYQTIFPEAFVPHLQQFDARVSNGTGHALSELEQIIDQGQPVIIYHTSLGQKPLHKIYHFDQKPTPTVANIHVTLLIGYDDTHYYYIDPLWSHLGWKIVFPAILPNKFQIIKISKQKMATSYNAPGQKCIYINPNSEQPNNLSSNR